MLMVDTQYGEETAFIACIFKHTHSYSAKYDSTDHWSECECGDVIGKEAHTFGEWNVTEEATDSKEGTKERTCRCGYAETEVIPATGKKSDDTSGATVVPAEKVKTASAQSGTTAKAADTVSTGDSSNVVLWLVILVACAGVATCVGVSRRRQSR